jgi:hypothetical protein
MSVARGRMFSIQCRSHPSRCSCGISSLHLANAGKKGYHFQRQNLADKRYVSSRGDALDGYYGAGRTFGAILRVQF